MNTDKLKQDKNGKRNTICTLIKRKLGWLY